MANWSEPSPVVLPGSTRYLLAANDEQWEISVWVPEDAAQRETSVLYVMDPSATFATTATIAATLGVLSQGRSNPLPS